MDAVDAPMIQLGLVPNLGPAVTNSSVVAANNGSAQFRAVYVPLPVSVIFCTLVRAESLIDRVPVRAPVCVGEKVTLIVQLFPTVSLAGQSFVSE